jgi:hypothetical protein
MERRIDATEKKRPAVRVSRALPLAAMFVMAATSCDSNIFDIDVDLSSVTLAADFGTTTATLPAIPCDPAAPAACAVDVVALQPTAGATVTVAPTCDAGALTCFADASAVLSQEVAVLQDDAFVTRVERRSTSLVESVDLAYTMPINTLSFDVTDATVYVGPSGSTAPTDAGVVLVDTLPVITAGQTFTEPRRLTIAAGTDAGNLIESSIRSKLPFAFILVVTTPRLGPGDPVPSGAFQIDILPTVKLGFP